MKCYYCQQEGTQDTMLKNIYHCNNHNVKITLQINDKSRTFIYYIKNLEVYFIQYDNGDNCFIVSKTRAPWNYILNKKSAPFFTPENALKTIETILTFS